MALVFKSGLLAAANTVQAYFDDNDIVAKVEVGWKRRMRQDNQSVGGGNRVVILPSDSSGAGGAITAPQFVGYRDFVDPLAVDPTRPVYSARELVGWERRVVLSIWAYDGTAPESEQAQIEAVETLFEWTARAIHGAPGCFAELTWGDSNWTVPTERSFGAELLVGLTFRHPIFDTPREIIYTTPIVNRGDASPAEPPA